jgi:uncharacterized OB-fold protein
LLYFKEVEVAENGKPLPSITSADRPFWEGAKRHELMAYKCLNCGSYYFPSTDCPRCDNPKMEWNNVSGKRQIYTFCIYHLAYHPAWEKSLPYNVAWIKLNEGPLLMSNIIGCENSDLYIGMPVEVVFENVNEEVTLPKFKPATRGKN